MAKKKKGDPKGLSQKRITDAMLKQHAPLLAKVFFSLQKKNSDLTSDGLWRAIKTYWDVKQLQEAISSSKKIALFTRLVLRSLEKMPRADKTGFFKADGEKWGVMKALSRLFKLHSRTLLIITPVDTKRREGELNNGHRAIFYRVSDVRRAVRELRALPQADKTGFFKADGEKWGTLWAYRRFFKSAEKLIKKYLDTTVRQRQGKDWNGGIRTFYALSDVRRAVRELRALPQADKTGFFKADGEKWGSERSLAKYFKTSPASIKKRINPAVRRYRGRVVNGVVNTFYALSDVRRAVRELRALPQADKTGFFKADGEKWGTVSSHSRYLRIDEKTIKKRLDVTVHRRKGRDWNGAVYTFHALSDVKRVCSDLLFLRLHERKKIGDALLRKHATVLAKVLPALRGRYPNLTSNVLWIAIRSRWDVQKLERASKAFERSRNLTPFVRLLSEKLLLKTK